MKDMNKKLNTLAKEYKETKEERMFEEIFKIVITRLKNRERNDANWVGCDISDIEEIHINAIFEAAKSYIPTKSNFTTHLNNVLNNMLMKEIRKKDRRPEEITKIEIKEDGQSEIVEIIETIPDNNSTEDNVRKKEQRQLLDSLCANIDKRYKDFTKDVVESYLVHGSIRKTAKSLKTNKTRVQRALSRLYRQYDNKKYGEITDYYISAVK